MSSLQTKTISSEDLKSFKDTSMIGKIAKEYASKAKPGEEIEVYVSSGCDVEISIYNGEVENMSTANSTALGIRVIVDHREGSAWTESLAAEHIEDALAAARENATIAEPDEYACLVTPGMIDDVEVTLKNGWEDSILTTSLEDKLNLALKLDKYSRSLSNQIKDVEASSYDDGWGHSVVANSHGIFVSNSNTSASCSTEMVFGDGKDAVSSNGFSYARGFNEIDFEEAAQMCLRDGLPMIGATQPISAKLPVIFDPRVSAQFLGIISSMLSGTAVAKGRALLGDRLGDKIANSKLTLIDDPTNELSFNSASYDGEGMPIRQNVFVENGVLKQFAHSMYSSRRLKMKANACAKRGGVASRPGAGMRSFLAVPTGESLEDIFEKVGEAIYVKHLLGVHSGVNALSGDFSVGVQGMWIREGHIAEAFKEATIASDLITMMSNVSAVANDTWWLPGSIVGNSILIDEMVMTGK
jgi:PmbA protein